MKRKPTMKKDYVLWQVQIPKASIEYHLFIKAPHDPKEALEQVLCTLGDIASVFKDENLPSLDDGIAYGESIYTNSPRIFLQKTKIELR